MLRETTSQGRCELVGPSRMAAEIAVGLRVRCVCFITAGPITELCEWGEEESGGHVL